MRTRRRVWLGLITTLALVPLVGGAAPAAPPRAAKVIEDDLAVEVERARQQALGIKPGTAGSDRPQPPPAGGGRCPGGQLSLLGVCSDTALPRR